jgi:hypothetical protein
MTEYQICNWISVKDRLPANEGIYIVFVDSDASQNGFFNVEAKKYKCMCKYSMERKYLRETDDDIIFAKVYKWDIDDVTHWIDINKIENPKKDD